MSDWWFLLPFLPVQHLAWVFMHVYMQGYNSWRDSLCAVPLYVVVSGSIAVIVTVFRMFRMQFQKNNTPLGLFFIYRMMMSLGLILLPISIALIINIDNEWQPEANKILYVLPFLLVTSVLLSGWALKRAWSCAPFLVVSAIVMMVVAGSIVARYWFWMTGTTYEDWEIIYTTQKVSGRDLMFGYLAFTVPIGAASIWYITRRNINSLFKTHTVAKQ